MPKIDLSAVPLRTGSGYPEPYASMMAGRSSLRLGDAGGLTQFGANMIILAPGALSSVRHWHETEDEFVLVVAGTVTLVDDTGETEMHPGEAAAFPAGDPNGHHFVNRSETEARFLVVGTRAPREVAHYPDVDMMVTTDGTGQHFTRRDGSPLP